MLTSEHEFSDDQVLHVLVMALMTVSCALSLERLVLKDLGELRRVLATTLRGQADEELLGNAKPLLHSSGSFLDPFSLAF